MEPKGDATQRATIESPLGANPFGKEDRRYQHWQTASRYAEEEWARFRADHQKNLPAESEDWKVFIEWRVTLVAGLFDIRAQWLFLLFVTSYETADLYVQELGRLREGGLSEARLSSPDGGRTEYLLSELKIRLSQRQQHWKAEGLRQAREIEQRKNEPQLVVQPAPAREGSQSYWDAFDKFVSDRADRLPHRSVCPQPASVPNTNQSDEVTVEPRDPGSSAPILADPSLKSGRKRGRRANVERTDAIRSAITKYGGSWRNHLGEIFRELDAAAVPLEAFGKMKIDLGQGHSANTLKWDDLDLAEGNQLREIIDSLRKYAD